MIVFFFSTLLRFMRNPASLFLPAVKMGSGRREPVRTFGAIMHQNKKGSGRPLRSAGTLYHRIPSYKEPSDRSSDFRIVARPRLPGSLSLTANANQWCMAAGLPDYSGGTVADLHRVPRCRCSSTNTGNLYTGTARDVNPPRCLFWGVPADKTSHTKDHKAVC